MVGCYDWLRHSPKKALATFEAGFEMAPSATKGIYIFLLADELGDNARRDEILTTLCTTPELKPKNPEAIRICQLIRDTLADGSGRPLDLAAVDQVLASIPAERRGLNELLVGKYLLKHGNPDAARKHLKRCADTLEASYWSATLAAVLLDRD
jgi:hypothetical protein